MELSILIVSFNTRELTLTCLRSVFEQTRAVKFEVLVADNASTDGSAAAIAAAFPQVKLLALEENVGFARANNLLAEQVQGRWLLLLNPDTQVLDQAIDRLVAFAHRHPEAGIFGGRTLFANGRLNPTSCWGRPTLWSAACFGLGLSSLGRFVPAWDTETMRGWNRDRVRRVDIISGCLLLISRSLWNSLGGFDPAFFMYGEDFDLCLRARRLGATCLFTPEATIIHHGGASSTARGEQIVRHMRAKSALIRKHWSALPAALGVWLLKLRVWTRAVGFALAGRVRPSLDAARHGWGEAWARRTEWATPPRTIT